MAQSKAREPLVKSFADRMVTDHSRMQREWTDLSSRNGVRFYGNLSAQHQEQINRLGRLSGTEFDRAYMTAMTQNHRDNVNTFQNTRRTTQSAELRQLLDRSLPTLSEHLALAREVSGRVGAAAPSPVATTADQGKHGNVKADAKFIRNIDADHYLEIRLGRLAERRAQDASVRRFGRQMAEDHTSLQAQWSSMAATNGMKFKSGMGPRHTSKLTRLEKLSGREFDREYMTLVLQNNQDYLDYFRKEGRAANSEPVRNLVDRGIPVLEQHLREGKQIGARVGADTVTTDSRYGKISIKDRDRDKDKDKDKPRD
jgi:predicted outer membrane protein